MSKMIATRTLQRVVRFHVYGMVDGQVDGVADAALANAVEFLLAMHEPVDYLGIPLAAEP
jgi:hypothetical protein